MPPGIGKGGAMSGLLRLSGWIDAINSFIGRNVSWLILAAVLVSAVNATVRKTFDISSNAWLELQWYLYGTVFFLAASYTLLNNEHVRIDILANRLRKRTRDWIDLICHILFLLPFTTLMLYLSVPWFLLSYRTGEMSGSAGGLIIWPAKFMIVAGFTLLTAQAISEIIKRIAVIAGIIEDPSPHHELPTAAEDALKMEGRDDA
jgi:TRAP-type mannitol/chloroaromatic compound transport system permease small subunit